MDKLSFSLFIIFAGLGSGYLLRRAVEASLIKLPFALTTLSRFTRDLGIMVMIPIAFLLAIWVLEFTDTSLLALPLICLFALIAGGLLGYGLGLLNKQDRPGRAVMGLTTSFTNIGAMGSLVVYLFLGEAGFALVTLYRLFEEIFYFLVGYPVAQWVSGKGSEGLTRSQRLIKVLKQPFLIAILTAFSLGFLFNLSGVERPLFLDSANDWVIPIGTFSMLVSVGLGLKVTSIARYFKYSVQVAITRVTLVPLFTLSMAWLVGLGEYAGGLALGVVLILSSMPPAVNSVVASAYYDLDVDLANSNWIVSTFSMALVVPWLYFALHLMQLV